MPSPEPFFNPVHLYGAKPRSTGPEFDTMAASIKKSAPARVVIDRIMPSLDNGRFAARCSLNKAMDIDAVIICDSHDTLKADLLYRRESADDWQRLPMLPAGNDIYRATITPDRLGIWFYTVEAAPDHFESWRDGIYKKLAAGEASTADLQTGIALIESAREKKKLQLFLRLLREITPARDSLPALREILDDETLRAILRAEWSPGITARFPTELPLTVDPPLAGFSAWYEFFPRSRWIGVAGRGTLKDAAERLPYVANMGFDIVYLPPIHPVGETFRKGRNNNPRAEPGEPGSPWAIGNKSGGHKAIDPDLGTFEDFAHLRDRAHELGLTLAMDIAFQCSPDHPYVTEHPEWFRHRPDGTIQYAENPPKKYQDIYPLDFEIRAWKSLWDELKSIVLFWAEKGVRVFRVDNPHTKAFAFWEWLIRDVRRIYPDAIFLAEAFTRPHVMAYLAKIGFSQSYTYFAWRRTKAELTAYMEELTTPELKYYFRPNFWPNTPDILPADLQTGNRAMYAQRLILAATLSSNYGIYGPAFELMDSIPAPPGREDYLNAEKYERRTWDITSPDSLAPLIARVNKIRHANPALQEQNDLMFHPSSNDQIIAYSRQTANNIIFIVVNLDPVNTQSAIVDFQIHKLGITLNGTYRLHDLLSDARYEWAGWRNYVELNPAVAPAHIFSITQTESTT